MKSILFFMISAMSLSSYSLVNTLTPLVSCTQSLESCGYEVEVIWNKDHQQPIEKKLFRKLERIANQQAQIWGDTILEGSYVSASATELIEIEVVTKKQKQVAYRITYSEKAFYTDDCNYDPENEASLEQCQAGKIQEKSFVSLNFKDSETDPLNYAEFYSDKD